MKKLITIAAAFPMLMIATSCSCERYEEAKNAVNAVKNLAENAESIQQSMEDANKRAQERKERGDTVAIHYEQLAEYLPEAFNGYEKEGEMDGGTTKTPGLGSYSNVEQKYLNANGDKVEVSLVDYNTAYAMYSTVMAAYAAGFEVDNTNEQIKGFEHSEQVKGWTILHKKDKMAEAYAGVSDRFYIMVKADNQEDVQLVMDVTTKEIPVDQLANL
jgi:hypothetical protein